MPQASGRLPASLRRFRLKTAAAIRASLNQNDDDSSITEFGAHGEPLTIAGRLRQRRRQLQQKSKSKSGKSKTQLKQPNEDVGDDEEDGKIPPLTTTFNEGPETNSIGGTVRLSNRGGRYSHEYQYEDDNVPRLIRQLADLQRADATNTFLPSHIPVDPREVSSQDFRQALVRELDADVLEVFFSLEFARDRRGREEMFDQLEVILTRIMKGVYLAGFTGDFAPVATAGEDKKWADYVQNRAHYKAVLRNKLKQELLGYQQLALKKLQILQEADDWFAGTTKLVDQEDMLAIEQLSKARYEAARLMLTDLKEMFDRMVNGLQRAKEYIEEGSKESSRFVPVQFGEEFLLKHGIILPPPTPQASPPGANDADTPSDGAKEAGLADGEPPKKKKRKVAQTSEASGGTSPDSVGPVEAGSGLQSRVTPTDPILLLPRSPTAKPVDYVVLHNIAAHASDTKYHPTALTTAKLLLYRAFGAQWTPASDRKQFLTLGFEQLDAFADGFQDLYRLKQEHQDQLMRQQTEVHIAVVDRYKTELKKLQERCKRAEADKYELRQKYEFLKKQAGDARMLGAVLLAGGGSADMIRESEEQRESQLGTTEKSHVRGGAFQPSTSMQEEESARASSKEQREQIIKKPAFGGTYGVFKPSATSVRTTPPTGSGGTLSSGGAPPNGASLPLPSFTYTDDSVTNSDGIRTTSQFPRRPVPTDATTENAQSTEIRTSVSENDDANREEGAKLSPEEEAALYGEVDDDFPEIEQFADPNDLYVVESQQNLSKFAKDNKKSPRSGLSASSSRARLPTDKVASQHSLLLSTTTRHHEVRPPTISNKQEPISNEDRNREQREQHKILALKALTIGHSPTQVRDLVLTAIPDVGSENPVSAAMARIALHSGTPDERAKISRVYKFVISQLLSYLGRLGEGKPTLRSLEATTQAFEALKLAKQLPSGLAHGRMRVKPKVLQEILTNLISGYDETIETPIFVRNIIENALATIQQQQMAKVIVINAVYGGNTKAQLDKISDALDIGVEKQHTIDSFLQKLKLQVGAVNPFNFFKCLMISTSRAQLDSFMIQTKLASATDMAKLWNLCETFGEGLISSFNTIMQANANKSLKRILVEISALFAATPDVGVWLAEQQKQLLVNEFESLPTNFFQTVTDLLKLENETYRIKRTVFRALTTADDLPEVFAILNAENVVLTNPDVEQAFVDAGLVLLTVDGRENVILSKKKSKRGKPSDEEMGQNELFLKDVLMRHGDFTLILNENEKRILQLSEIFTAIAHARNVEDAVGLLRATSMLARNSSDLEVQLLQLLLTIDQNISAQQMFGLLKAICVSDSLPQLRAVVDLFQPHPLKQTHVDLLLQRLGVLPPKNGSSLSNTHDFTDEQENYALVAIMKLKQKMPFLRRALIVLAVCDDFDQMKSVLSTLGLPDDSKQTGMDHFECMLEFATAIDDDSDEADNTELNGAAVGTIEALGISFDADNIMSILSHKNGSESYNSSGMLTALYMLKLFGCGNEGEVQPSRLLSNNSIANRIERASHDFVVAAPSPTGGENDNMSPQPVIAAGKNEIEAHDILEMLVLAKNSEQAVEILQELDNNQHVLHISNTIDFNKFKQTVQFGRQTALLTCQALSLSPSVAHLLPVMDCLGVDRNDFMVNETFDALGYGLLSLTPQKIQQHQQQQKLRQQSMSSNGGSGGSADAGRRVSSALQQLNRKRRAEEAAAAAGRTSASSGPKPVSSTASTVADRLAFAQQIKKQTPPPAVATADARKSKTLSAPSSRPGTASPVSRQATPDAQLSSSAHAVTEGGGRAGMSALDESSADAENPNLSLSPLSEDEQGRSASAELNHFDDEFAAFNAKLDDDTVSSPSKSALVAEQHKKQFNIEPSFKVTNQVHIMARQHQRNPAQIGDHDWETLKVQVEDLEHQLFEQTNLEQSQLQQIRWLKQENKTMTAKLEQQSAAQAPKNAKVTTAHQHSRASKTEISQTPHEWFSTVTGLAQSTATLPKPSSTSLQHPQPLPLRETSSSMTLVGSGQRKDTSKSKFETAQNKLLVAKAKQAINRAKLHAFVEKLKVIHYHATSSQPLLGSRSTLSPVKEEDEEDEEEQVRASTQKSSRAKKPPSPSPVYSTKPPSKIEALQIITNALDALGSDMVFSIGVVTDVDNYFWMSPPSPAGTAPKFNEELTDEEYAKQLPPIEHKLSHAVVMEHVLLQLQQELVALVGSARELVLQADADYQSVKEQLAQNPVANDPEENQAQKPEDELILRSSAEATMRINIEAKLESLAEAIDDVAIRYEAALEKEEKKQEQNLSLSAQQKVPSAAVVKQPRTVSAVRSDTGGVARQGSQSKLTILLDEPIMKTVANLTLNDLNTKLRHIAHRLVVMPNRGRITEEEDESDETSEIAAADVMPERMAQKVEFKEEEKPQSATKTLEEKPVAKVQPKKPDDVTPSKSTPTVEKPVEPATKKSTTTLQSKPSATSVAAVADKPKPAIPKKPVESRPPPSEPPFKKESKQVPPPKGVASLSPPLKPSASIKPVVSSTSQQMAAQQKVAQQQQKSSRSSTQPQHEKPLIQLQRQLVLERQVTNTILQQLNVLSDDASIPQRISLQQQEQQQHSVSASVDQTADSAKQTSPPQLTSLSPSSTISPSSPQTRRQLNQIAATRAAIDHFKQEALVQRAQVSPPLLSSPALTIAASPASADTPLTVGDVATTTPADVNADISLMSEPVTIEAIAVEQRIRADLLSNINQLITANIIADNNENVEVADFTTQVRIPSPDKPHPSSSPTVSLADHEAIRATLESRIKSLNESMQAETTKLTLHHKRLRIFFERKIRDLNDKHTKTFILCAQRLQQVVTRCNQHAEDILYAVKVHLPETVSHNVPLTTMQVDATQLQDDLEIYFPELYNELDRVMSATRFMVKAAVHQMDVKLADVYEEIENAQAGRHSSLGSSVAGGGKRRTVNAADDAEYQRLVGALQQMDLMLSDEKRSQAVEMADKTRKLEQLMRDYAVLEQSSAKMKDQLVQQLDEKQAQVSKAKKECAQMKRIIDGQREKMTQLYDMLDARKREIQRAVVLKCSDLRRACEQLHFAYEQQAIDLEVYEALRECTQIVRHLPQMQLCRIFERFVKYAYLRTNQQHLADDAVQRDLKLDFATRLKLTAVERRVSERNEQLAIDTRRTRNKRDEILSELNDTYQQLGLITADRQLFDLNQLVLVPRKKPLKSKSAQRRSSTGEREKHAEGRLDFSMPNKANIAALYKLAENETLLATAAAAAAARNDEAEQPQQLGTGSGGGGGGGDHLLYVRNVLLGQNAPEQNFGSSATYRKPGYMDDSSDPTLYVKGLALDVDKTHETIGRRKWTLTTPDHVDVPQQQQPQFSVRTDAIQGKKPPFLYAQPYGVAYDLNWHRIQGLRAATAAARDRAYTLSPAQQQAAVSPNRPPSANKNRISYPLAQSGLVYGDVDVNDVESVEAEGQVKTYVGTNLMRTPLHIPHALNTYVNHYSVRGVVAVPPLESSQDADEHSAAGENDLIKALNNREHVLQLIEEARYRHAYKDMLRKQQKKSNKQKKQQQQAKNVKLPQGGASSPDLII